MKGIAKMSTFIRSIPHTIAIDNITIRDVKEVIWRYMRPSFVLAPVVANLIVKKLRHPTIAMAIRIYKTGGDVIQAGIHLARFVKIGGNT
ncbi:hypothetical protein KAI23_07055 [Candidatus Bathyarchaeota archaeon]|nr:hypothetical protein [Candidatus Bathyarchaeota archaeon]